MKIVFLTSGPRGVGKSTYMKRIQAAYPDVVCLSRDELLRELFGATALSPYTGEHEYAAEIFKQRLQEALAKEGDVRLIADYWNGFSRSRKSLISLFREYGADVVVCWQFAVPLETCLRWFFKKDDSKGYSESGIRRDYRLYYDQAVDIYKDGFDSVHRINPCQLTFHGFPLI